MTSSLKNLEDSLLALWRSVFRIEDLEADDDFYKLGGHSLLAMRLVTRINEELGIHVQLRTLMNARTVRRLAASLRGEQSHRAGDAAPFPVPAPPVPATDTFPLSSGQERLWFVEQLEPGNRAYMFQCVMRFSGLLDVPALERALTEVVARHGALRSTFHVREGQPSQRVHPPRPVVLPLYDLTRMPEADRAAEAQALIDREVRRPFDLEEGPIARWSLYRTGESEHLFLHHEHHLVHDGWSFRLFVGELLRIYAALTQGMPPALTAPATQLGDFAVAEAEWLKGPTAARQLEFWKSRLRAGVTPLSLPFDRPRAARQSLRGSSFRVQLPLALCRAARELSRHTGVSLYVVLLAAFQALLRRCTGADLVPTGCGVANRRSRAIESVVGMFVNNIVLQTDLSANPTFAELMHNIHLWSVEAQENSDVPFDRVVRAVGETYDPGRNPLFQAMFNEHAAPLPDVILPGVRLAMEEAVSNGSAKFDLNVIAMPHSPQLAALGSGIDPDSIVLLWEFSTDLFEKESVARLARDYSHLLEVAVADCSIRVDALPLRETRATERSPGPSVGAAEAAPVKQAARADAPGSDAARASLEEGLIAIWKSVLGVKAVGPDDDFFELGGHSLLAMRIVARIETDMGRRVKLRAIFDAPTIRGLAAKLS